MESGNVSVNVNIVRNCRRRRSAYASRGAELVEVAEGSGCVDAGGGQQVMPETKISLVVKTGAVLTYALLS